MTPRETSKSRHAASKLLVRNGCFGPVPSSIDPCPAVMQKSIVFFFFGAFCLSCKTIDCNNTCWHNRCKVCGINFAKGGWPRTKHGCAARNNTLAPGALGTWCTWACWTMLGLHFGHAGPDVFFSSQRLLISHAEPGSLASVV